MEASHEPAAASTRFTPRGTPRPTTLRFRGALDAHTAARALAQAEAAIYGPSREVILDLSAVERLDSEGVRVLIAVHDRVKARGGLVALVGAKDQPRFVLDLVRAKLGVPL